MEETHLLGANWLSADFQRIRDTVLGTAAPEHHVLPWTVPSLPHDLLVTPEGTIMVSTGAGVHVLGVDPEEAVRSAHPA